MKAPALALAFGPLLLASGLYAVGYFLFTGGLQ
jgi:hypothetical protein